MADLKNETAAPIEKDSETTDTTSPVTDDTVATENQAPVTEQETETSTTDDSDVTPVSATMKRAELTTIATEAGLVNVAKYKNRDDIVSAIERVRGGEDAATVDTEYAPLSDDKGGDVEVTVVAPFYDMQQKATRRQGTTYHTTEARATELRKRNLVK